MFFFDLLRLTLSSLKSNLLRSGLTSLGVFMGVGAVMSTLQVRTISNSLIQGRLTKREAPQMLFFPSWKGPSTPQAEIKPQDIEYLKQQISGKVSISGSVVAFSLQEAVADDQKTITDGLAVQLDFLKTTGRALEQGRFFSPVDFVSFRPVAVIDQLAADQLFPDRSAINQNIYVDNNIYTVVGVIESKEPNSGKPTAMVLLPFPLYSAISGNLTFDQIAMRPQQIEELEKLGEEAKRLLDLRFGPESFDSWSNIDDIREQQQLLATISLSLLGVAAIALLVGGVGIANISVASILERTPEIGLRRAIGATKSEIMLQFILEAILVSLLGGSVAIASVHGATLMVAKTFELPYEFDRQTAILALSSALVVGVGASFFPALRASQLDPVQALRNN